MSPDGSAVAYGDRDGLVIVSADGKSRRLVVAKTTPGGLDAVSWSPKGDAIAYAVCCVAGTGLYVVRPDGTNQRRVAVATPTNLGEPGADFAAAWSPDGQQLVTNCGHELCRVGADGGDPATLTQSFARESSFAPAWSSDGNQVAYLHGRGSPSGNDVYVMNVDGSGNRALTRTFPDGGDNVAPGWRTARITLKQCNRPLRLVDLNATRSTSSGNLITLLGARASSAAFVEGDADFASCGVRLWAPHLTARWRNLCVHDPYPEGATPGRPLPTASGAAWVRQAYARDAEFDDVVLAPIGGKPAAVRRPRSARKLAQELWLGPLLVTPLGIECSAQSNRGSRMDLWRLVGHRLVVVATGLVPGVVESAYHGLLAARTRRGEIEVLTDEGRLVARFKGRGATGVAVSAAGIVGVTASNVLERWTFRGGRVRTYQLVRRATTPARLEDADGQYAVYVAGAAIHVLRLTDGRDVVVDEPTSAAPVHAQLEQSGLYVSYSETYSATPGRVAFVPRTELQRAIEAGSP
jgi:hypothetical protein